MANIFLRCEPTVEANDVAQGETLTSGWNKVLVEISRPYFNRLQTQDISPQSWFSQYMQYFKIVHDTGNIRHKIF